MSRQFSYCCAVLLWTGVVLVAQQAKGPVPTPAKSEVQQSGTTQPPPGTPPTAVPAAPPAGNETAVPIYKYEVKGRRDPFRSLDVTRTVQAASAPVVRPPGLKGQLVSEIRVVGVVKSKGALMAIVQGYRNKTFFVHPDDLLYDGKVLEVRNDAVVLSQILTDNQGKKTSQQVVKKLYPTRGEGNNEK
jgi:Pilus assembly protein, PilP